MFLVSSTFSTFLLAIFKVKEAIWTKNKNLNDRKEVYLKYIKKTFAMLSDFKDKTNFHSSEACQRCLDVN